MTRADADDLSRLRYVAGADRQAGVLAWQPGTDLVRFVIITSRRSGRWVFPKGTIDPGMTPEETALAEALEEAGLTGTLGPGPIGVYRAPKIRPPLIWTVEVEIFPMRIDRVLESWDEADQRTRRFVTLDEARDLLAQPDMAALAERFFAGRSGTP